MKIIKYQTKTSVSITEDILIVFAVDVEPCCALRIIKMYALFGGVIPMLVLWQSRDTRPDFL